MRFLLLNQTFHPDVAATAQVLTGFALGLKERGHVVTAVASDRAYVDPDVRFVPRELWRGIEIHRIRGTGLGKGAKWRRAVDFASFLAACAFKMITLPRADVTVALTSPPLISVLGALLACLRGGRFVYWVMDLNPDEAVAAGWLRASSLAARALEAASRFSFRRAAKIIALDSFMADRIAAKGIARDKIEVIPPWSHDEAVRFDAEGRERFRVAHGLSGKFVVMYSGNHSPCHPLDTVLEAARVLVGDERFVFCFVGGGSEHPKVKGFATRHGLRNVLCLPYQPLDQLAGSLSAADLHLVVMGEQFVGMIHPCKIYNILTVGAPVLYVGPRPSHVTEILSEVDDPEVTGDIQHGDVAGLVKCIRRIKAARRRGDPNRCQRVAKKFSQGRLLPKFMDVIEGLSAVAMDAPGLGLANPGSAPVRAHPVLRTGE